jgi:hypothetical protein
MTMPEWEVDPRLDLIFSAMHVAHALRGIALGARQMQVDMADARFQRAARGGIAVVAGQEMWTREERTSMALKTAAALNADSAAFGQFLETLIKEDRYTYGIPMPIQHANSVELNFMGTIDTMIVNYPHLFGYQERLRFNSGLRPAPNNTRFAWLPKQNAARSNYQTDAFSIFFDYSSAALENATRAAFDSGEYIRISAPVKIDIMSSEGEDGMLQKLFSQDVTHRPSKLELGFIWGDSINTISFKEVALKPPLWMPDWDGDDDFSNKFEVRPTAGVAWAGYIHHVTSWRWEKITIVDSVEMVYTRMT